MALLCPSLPRRPLLTAGDHAEHAVLDQLAQGLPDAYLLFHSRPWAEDVAAGGHHGEVDIIVLNQAGDLLLIEVKAGEVQQVDGDLVKAYGDRRCQVLVQASHQLEGVRSRLYTLAPEAQAGHLLVLPQGRVGPGSLRWPRACIVDSSELPDLARRVQQALPVGLPRPALRARVQAFLEDRFDLQPDVSALAGQVQQQVTRLSAGLATWVPRIQAPEGVLRVQGTAGSGKTQLALALLREAGDGAGRAAYVCFNRALADHMARHAHVRVLVDTFHGLALAQARCQGLAPASGPLPGWDAMAAAAVEAWTGAAPDLDLLVIDELQDLQPAWVEALLARLKPGGRAVLLEDPDQQLYPDRPPFDIEGAVLVRSPENFRSPRVLVDLANRLGLTPQPVRALSPWQGELPDPLVYAPAAGPEAATRQAVQRCLDRGHALADIAVVSLAGRERSRLQGLAQLGPWGLRRFTGRFDEGGNAVWAPGVLLIDSVRRFKGQAAPAVVLTECELPDLSGLNARLLFTGLTRARLHLEWVVSEGFAQVLTARLQG